MRNALVVMVIVISATVAAFGQANAPSKPLTALEQTLMSAEKDDMPVGPFVHAG